MIPLKKRILFVDDEPLVLEGLQRVLRPLRDEWDMEFLDSGSKALTRMALVPFDMVVSDMQMPGMNGAELLGRVMQTYPRTIRLILSGQASKELIFKCVGSTHQFLAKPCNPDDLKSIMRRASAMSDALDSEALKRLVGQISSLPSLPTIYCEIIETLSDPDVTLETVGNIIAQDFAMTAKILKLVNSPFFGLQHVVANPAEAASFLGLDTIRSLVLLTKAFAPYESVSIPGFSFLNLWTHSLEVGVAAKALVRMESTDRKLADEAFVSGLLHDIGKTVLAANFPEKYTEILRLVQRGGGEECQIEKEFFGATHADVGGCLFSMWGLPVPVVEAITFHHRPAQGDTTGFSPLTAVHVANALVQPTLKPGDSSSSIPRLDHDYLVALGLAERIADWRNCLSRA